MIYITLFNELLFEDVGAGGWRQVQRTHRCLLTEEDSGLLFNPAILFNAI
jgi:hypothetical protein